MFFGGAHNGAFGIRPVQQKFKTEKVPVEKKPPPLKSRHSSNDVRDGRTITTTAPTTILRSASTAGENMGRNLQVPGLANVAGKKRKADSNGNSTPRKRSPMPQQKTYFEDSDSEEDDSTAVKKVKVESLDVDPKRKLRDRKAFSPENDGGIKEKMIDAADVMMRKRKDKKSEGRGNADDVVVLRYPSSRRTERYQLVSEDGIINPYEEELINPYEEITKIVGIFNESYLTEEQRVIQGFQDPETGIPRQVQKAANIVTNLLDPKRKPYDPTFVKQLLPGFRDAVGAYNNAVKAMVKDGTIAKNLDNMHSLPPKLVQMILKQVYDRAVSPQVELLQKYTNGTSYVYGEMLFPFISRILKRDTCMKSDQVFVDLGSGVGNVVLQAALQIGCESWGCEYMSNACDLAAKQKKEFSARCRAWGVSTGSVHLERGDFLENTRIHEAMRRADVIVVNNQVFLPELNQSLLNLFLDLKDGCKIVSLQSFVPDGHEINARNFNNPVNLLAVKKEFFGADDVSWQGGGGEYYIATKDSSRLAKYKSSRRG